MTTRKVIHPETDALRAFYGVMTDIYPHISPACTLDEHQHLVTGFRALNDYAYSFEHAPVTPNAHAICRADVSANIAAVASAMSAVVTAVLTRNHGLKRDARMNAPCSPYFADVEELSLAVSGDALQTHAAHLSRIVA